MREPGVLLSFFDTYDLGLQAKRELDAAGFSRSAFIHKHVDGSYRDQAGRLPRPVVLRRAVLALLLLGLAALALTGLISRFLPGMPGYLLRGILLGVAAAGGRWLLGSRPQPVERRLRDRQRRWLVPGETLVIVQTAPERMTAAQRILKGTEEPRPSIFVLHPARVTDPDGEALLGDPMSAADLRIHAERLSLAHLVEPPSSSATPLLDRITPTQKAFESIAARLDQSSRMDIAISSSAEWILDNAYIVLGHIADVRLNLPDNFYQQLPVMIGGRRRGLPRIHEVAAELVQHSGGRIDRHNIFDFLAAYQEDASLTIGELWAVPLMLRLILIESIRQLAEQVEKELRERERADLWAYRLLAVSRRAPDDLFALLGEMVEQEPEPSANFALQISSHLYDEESVLVAVRTWLGRKLQHPLDDVVMLEQARQAAVQFQIGNAITSLRQLSLVDWREIFEKLSQVDHALRRDPAGVYHQMDFDTRNSYRAVIEEVSRCSGKPEWRVAQTTVELAQQAADLPEPGVRQHVGYYLLDAGRRRLMDALGCREAPRRRVLNWIYRKHALVYIAPIVFFSLLVSVWFGYLVLQAGWPPLIAGLLGLISAFPASQLATQALNFSLTRVLPPQALPKMSFKEHGIPDQFSSLVVVPMLMTDCETITAEIEKLEVRYLANRDPNLVFSLFADFADAEQEHTDEDPILLDEAVRGIERLNERYGTHRFFLFSRPRVWVETERKYIGWERKRGKLDQLNRLILGENGAGSAELINVGSRDLLRQIRFVITLDSDTLLPRDSARRLVETIAHPLNQPGRPIADFSGIGNYTIIQPRVSPSLPSATATAFSRLFSDPLGSDPYTKLVSDAYQDLAGQGSYVGKGIYDPRSFHAVLHDRFPQERLLSHDLIEGAHVRVGLASDIELLDDFPSDYITHARREHRWIRGDWQIADWILPRVPALHGRRIPNLLNTLNRWKIFDNLRRSLVPPAIVALLGIAWTFSPALGLLAGLLAGLVAFFPPLSQLISWLIRRGQDERISWRNIWHDTCKAIVDIVLWPHAALVALDAIGRVWFRRLISRRKLLEWRPANVGQRMHGSPPRLMLTLGGVSLLSIAAGILLSLYTVNLLLALPFLLLWAAAPIVGWLLISAPTRPPQETVLPETDQTFLRRVARKTWRYFDDFVGERSNWLPPDNYQVSHSMGLALRTSPTNIGLWMLSLLGANDFGYLSPSQVFERLDSTLTALGKLERYRGHLLNWYDLETLSPLLPRYVSTVDSGNYLASLWTLETGLDELIDAPLIGPRAIDGLLDTLDVLREALAAELVEPQIEQAMADLQRILEAAPDLLPGLIRRLREAAAPVRLLTRGLVRMEEQAFESGYWAQQLERQLLAWLALIDTYLPWVETLAEKGGEEERAISSARFARRGLLAHAPSLPALAAEDLASMRSLKAAAAAADDPPAWVAQVLDAYQQTCRTAAEDLQRFLAIRQRLAAESDGISMRFLYDADQRLFTIGYNVSIQRRDTSHYDLLASEARLGSFVAIAAGDVPGEHWLSLARPIGAVGRRRVLLSWTGTMFEYLMPPLFQRVYRNSLLELAQREAVAAQRSYADRRRVPWGISESAYSDLNGNKTYQYKAFGVPGLGLKRGLEEDIVVAPYATLLALGVDPLAAIANLKRLGREGLQGGYGFFEAVDYGRRRTRDGEHGVIVHAYMAHHQGMGFIALANLLHDQAFQRRFHADPRVRATEPLLYERIPPAAPRTDGSGVVLSSSRVVSADVSALVSKFDSPHTPTPKVQLLSNGSYKLMVTAAGGGYSRWREFDLTRWRADTTRDDWGTFCYIKDLQNGRVWSNTFHPIGGAVEEHMASLAIDRAEFRRLDEGIETQSEILISPEDDVEIRRITLINRSGRIRELEITSYAELALAAHNSDLQHPAFSKLFVQTEALPEMMALLATRRLRSPEEKPVWFAHRITLEQAEPQTFSFETDRRRFIGRGRDLANPIALGDPLSNTEGQVLDPVFSLRRMLSLKPGQQLQFSLVLAAGERREDVVDLISRYGEFAAITRAFDLAWTHAQYELRQLRIRPEEARRFQHLASYLLYPSDRLRPPGDLLRQNTLDQSRLWAYGISGDLPIAMVRISDERSLSLVRELLQAHAYWRLHGLEVDLLILNEEAGSYDQPLQDQLQRMIHGQTLQVSLDQPGGVFLRSADQLPEEDLMLLYSVARVSLSAARGTLPRQFGPPVEEMERPSRIARLSGDDDIASALPFIWLQHFNGLGGFTEDGREYVIQLSDGALTPAPWVNVIANPSFGTLISESGSGFTWYGNSQRNRLTGWSNDPVSDPPSEAIYIRDEESGRFWTPTPLPIRSEDAYRIRHGAGYTVCEHNSHGIEHELTTFIPNDPHGGEPLRLQRLRLTNDTDRIRRLSITSYLEWTLGENRESSQLHVHSRWDDKSRAFIVRNRYHPDYGDRVAFAAMSPAPISYTADRMEFIGRNRNLRRPEAMRRSALSGKAGAGLDPCAAMQVVIEIEPGEMREIVCMLGQVGDSSEVSGLVRKYRESLIVSEALARTQSWWDDLLGQVQISIPTSSAEPLINRWLLYQTLSSRIWARSGFYQSGGAYGFRDQLQDVMALLHTQPDLARSQILLAASRQFADGDVQHWWHPPGGAGIRSRISDDLLWLPYVVHQYVLQTGDEAILQEEIAFIEGPQLENDQHEIFIQPQVTDERATLYEHCQRAIEKGLTSGEHQLPLFGSGDWNDGMNRVGIEGRGESVWLAWFLIEVLSGFADLAQRSGQTEEAENYRKRQAALIAAIETHAWDGAWYMRGFYDDGSPLGSKESEEAQIDSLPQSWAAITAAGDPQRAEQALDSAREHLVRPDEKLILLFTPPFQWSSADPGYIKGYPPGVRENGGQYTHAALWMAMAFARRGDGATAVRLLQMINPIEHSLDMTQLQRYMVEPFVIAADVYRLPGRVGQGGWTWYTGSAGWMYRVWLEEILGIKLRGDQLLIDPVIPGEWKAFNIHYRHGKAVYEINIENPEGVSRGVLAIEFDGRPLKDGFIPLEKSRIKHRVTVTMGAPKPAPKRRTGTRGASKTSEPAASTPKTKPKTKRSAK